MLHDMIMIGIGVAIGFAGMFVVTALGVAAGMDLPLVDEGKPENDGKAKSSPVNRHPSNFEHRPELPDPGE